MKTDVKEKMAQKIKAARKDAKLSQIELCRIGQFSQSALSRWERGERSPNATELLKIAKATDKPLEYFSETGDLPARPKTMSDLMDIIRRQEKDLEQLRTEQSSVASSVVDYESEELKTAQRNEKIFSETFWSNMNWLIEHSPTEAKALIDSLTKNVEIVFEKNQT